MEYKIIRSDSYLEHHGILGQKWGVRRYQNPDGSLTAEGKKRYSNADGSLNEVGQKHLYKSMKKSVEKFTKQNKNDSNHMLPDVGQEAKDSVKQAIDNNKKVVKEYRDAMKSYNDFESDFEDNEKLLREYAKKAFKSNDPDILEIKMDLGAIGLTPEMLDVLSIDSRVSSAAFNIYISKGEKGYTEFKKIDKRYDDAVNDYLKMQKEVTKALLGKYGNRTINDSYHSKLPRSAAQVLISEINDQARQYLYD